MELSSIPLSHLQRHLNNITPPWGKEPALQTPPPLLKWEKLLKTAFTPHQWSKAFKIGHKVTLSASLRELQIKIPLRWYITPSLSAKFKNGSQDTCWRNCGQIGSLKHILWDCPPIASLWTEIFHLISTITNTQIPPTPELALLNLSTDTIPVNSRTVALHILLATRISITRKWKSTQPPTLTEIINTTQTHHTYELIMTHTHDSYQREKTKWSQWSDWYSNYLSLHRPLSMSNTSGH